MYDGFVPTDRDNTPRLLLAFYIGVVIVFLALGVTYWNFQVVQHARFSGRAENNYQQTLALRAPRGVVFDRDGRVLVENRYSLNISLVRERVTDQARESSLADVEVSAQRFELNVIVLGNGGPGQWHWRGGRAALRAVVVPTKVQRVLQCRPRAQAAEGRPRIIGNT